MTSFETSLRLRIEAVRDLAADCKLFEFAHEQGGILPSIEPGAHIGVLLPNGIERQYSLLNSGPQPERYLIGVKRDPASRGGSTYMVDQLKVGQVLSATAPRNNFPLHPRDAESVFIAGGIGITPIWCMIGHLEKLGRPWRLHYATRSRADAPFAAELDALAGAHLHFDDVEGRVLPIADILAVAPRTAHFYCCGPAPMLAAFEAAAQSLGLAPEQIHVEYFTQKYDAATEGGFIVEMARSGKDVRINPGETILAAVRIAGASVPSSCEEGICGACETKVIAGEPDHRDAILTESERKANKTMFICCSGSKSERLVLDL